jgi:polyisoprenoid-binding protein YceI
LRLAAAVALCLSMVQRRAEGQETDATFDAGHTQVTMTLDATAHTVHGSFKLKAGSIRFDPQSGKCRGEVVIDATSGDTGNSSRDRKMHQEVLESEKYPEISFLPDQLKGNLPQHGSSQVLLSGTFRLHGQDHPLSFMADVDAPTGNQIHVKAGFSVPYAKWGVKNPSNFFLRVGDSVEIEIDAVAQLRAAAVSNP